MSGEKKPELTPQQKEWLRLASFPTGHPERHGYAKCSRCGAYRAKERIAHTAGLTVEAGAHCIDGCTPVSIENDPRRELRRGRYPNDPVEGTVALPVAPPTSSAVLSVINPITCPHGKRRDDDCSQCAEMRALAARLLDPELSS